MTETDRTTLTAFADRLKQQFPRATVWAFGSRVRGEAGVGSDFDVCVVLPKLDSTARQHVSDIAWEVGFEAGTVLSTVVFSKAEFEERSRVGGPLVRAIERDGVAA